jgi:hypothetical protein
LVNRRESKIVASLTREETTMNWTLSKSVILAACSIMAGCAVDDSPAPGRGSADGGFLPVPAGSRWSETGDSMAGDQLAAIEADLSSPLVITFQEYFPVAHQGTTGLYYATTKNYLVQVSLLSIAVRCSGDNANSTKLIDFDASDAETRNGANVKILTGGPCNGTLSAPTPLHRVVPGHRYYITSAFEAPSPTAISLVAYRPR